MWNALRWRFAQNKGNIWNCAELNSNHPLHTQSVYHNNTGSFSLNAQRQRKTVFLQTLSLDECNILHTCHKHTEIALGEYELIGEHHPHPGSLNPSFKFLYPNNFAPKQVPDTFLLLSFQWKETTLSPITYSCSISFFLRERSQVFYLYSIILAISLRLAYHKICPLATFSFSHFKHVEY